MQIKLLQNQLEKLLPKIEEAVKEKKPLGMIDRILGLRSHSAISRYKND